MAHDSSIPFDDELNALVSFFDHRSSDNAAIMRVAPLNTDINLPPLQAWTNESNYSSIFEMGYGSQYASSIHMGHAFADSAANSVNLVGSGKTIKKLLMEPYAAGPMSLLCHRVGKTIYLDSESFSKKKEFEMVNGIPSVDWEPMELPTFKPDYPQLTLYENYIWHNKAVCAAVPESDSFELQLVASRNVENSLPRMFQSYSYQIQPQDSLGGQAYLWEFHDTRMLVDVDIPIFGGGQFPCVSIKLSEETKPISVLTGMDIMLEQLMYNLSETIMVYHNQGVIREYEAVVTEELPYITGSEFDPSKLKNITENMMSFLSNNVAQQGHTYWLFRDKNSDEIKLYDLTSLCPQLSLNPQWNPFLTPVVSLLYKLGTDLMRKTEAQRSSKASNVIFGLLKAASDLLTKDTLPEYKACIHYCIAGLYLRHDKHSNVDDTAILGGLDDLKLDGYSKLSSSIKVDDLFKEPSEESSDDETGKESTTGRMPNSSHDSDCLNEVVEHCAQALRALDAVSTSNNTEGRSIIPFIGDGADDRDAYLSIQGQDTANSVAFLRRCLLLKTATAISMLAEQAIAVDRHDKIYHHTRLGIACCEALYAKSPRSVHGRAARRLLPCLTTMLLNSMTQLSGPLSSLQSLLDCHYREYHIIMHAKAIMKGAQVFEKILALPNNCETVDMTSWQENIEKGLDRTAALLTEKLSSKSKFCYEATNQAILRKEEVVCRLGSVYNVFAMHFTNLATMKHQAVKEDEDTNTKDARRHEALETVHIARRLYVKAEKFLKAFEHSANVKAFTAMFKANMIVTFKQEYRILFYQYKATDMKVLDVVEQICTAYTSVLELASSSSVDVKASGHSVYHITLAEFAAFLIDFNTHLCNVDPRALPDLRINYLQAAKRSAALLSQRSTDDKGRKAAHMYLAQSHYFLLDLLVTLLRSKSSNNANDKNRAALFLDVLHEAFDFYQSRSIEELTRGIQVFAKRLDIFLMTALGMSGRAAIEAPTLCIKCLQVKQRQLLALEEMYKTSPDDESPQFAKECFGSCQEILKYMMATWGKSDAAIKQAYLSVLTSVPDDTDEMFKTCTTRMATAVSTLLAKK